MNVLTRFTAAIAEEIFLEILLICLDQEMASPSVFEELTLLISLPSISARMEPQLGFAASDANQ